MSSLRTIRFEGEKYIVTSVHNFIEQEVGLSFGDLLWMVIPTISPFIGGWCFPLLPTFMNSVVLTFSFQTLVVYSTFSLRRSFGMTDFMLELVDFVMTLFLSLLVMLTIFIVFNSLLFHFYCLSFFSLFVKLYVHGMNMNKIILFPFFKWFFPFLECSSLFNELISSFKIMWNTWVLLHEWFLCQQYGMLTMTSFSLRWFYYWITYIKYLYLLHPSFSFSDSVNIW